MLGKKGLSAILIFCLCVGMVGCGKSEKNKVAESYDSEFNILANQVEDSSDLPTWEGEQLKIKVWYAQGSAWRQAKLPTDDVVSKEIARVTGVTIDTEESFENVEGLQDAELAKLIASNQWPDIIIGPEASTVDTLVSGNYLYELTPYFEKYCTNINTLYSENENLKNSLASIRKDGKMYSMLYSPTKASLKYTNPEIDSQRLDKFSPLPDRYPYVYVRDDILKMIYPNAKTQKELEEIYMRDGGFKFEDVTDVTFSSKEEFFDFLYKVKELNLTENGRKVEAFYNVSSADNWNLLTLLGGIYGYNLNGDIGANYFTYWDKETDRVEYMYEQPFFKEALWDLTKLIIDGVSSKEALVDQRIVFNEKGNNGQYAVLYGWDTPSVFELKDKDFGYRKVYLTIPQKNDKFLFAEAAMGGNTIAILNKNIKEENLPQLMRYIDFFASKAGQKLVYWGPKDAGLFTETDGKLEYTDKELEADLVKSAENKKRTYYGIDGQAWAPYPTYLPNLYHPYLICDLERDPADTYGAFSYKHFEPFPEMKQSYVPDIWLFDAAGIEGVKSFWKARTAFEEQILKIYVSKDREEFEKNYQELIDNARRQGMTEETLNEINEYFAEYNAEYMKNIK